MLRGGLGRSDLLIEAIFKTHILKNTVFYPFGKHCAGLVGLDFNNNALIRYGNLGISDGLKVGTKLLWDRFRIFRREITNSAS